MQNSEGRNKQFAPGCLNADSLNVGVDMRIGR